MSEAPGSEVTEPESGTGIGGIGSTGPTGITPGTAAGTGTAEIRPAGDDDEEVEGLAPLGGPAEAEPPQHRVDPDRVVVDEIAADGTASGGTAADGTASGGGRSGATADTPVEDSVAYELAVEDGAALAAASGAPAPGTGGTSGSGSDTHRDADSQGPEFREPGAP